MKPYHFLILSFVMVLGCGGGQSAENAEYYRQQQERIAEMKEKSRDPEFMRQVMDRHVEAAASMAAEEKAGGGNVDVILAQIRPGMSRGEVRSRLGEPSLSQRIGLGEMCIYYVSDEDAIAISFDKHGGVFTVNKQKRNK